MIPHSNSKPYSAQELILATIVVFLGIHVSLSSMGLVPTEVSAFNQQVISAVQKLHTITYTRQPVTESTSSSTRKLPEPPRSTVTPTQMPQRIVIDKIGVSSPIKNPERTKVSVLNAALKKGVVRYPGSGGLTDNRTMFLFGHSSRLPAATVQNDAYRVFNGLGELSVGDTITIHGTSTTKKFTVQSVRVVDKDKALVNFSRRTGGLTLSTCTTFGAKENRVVVRATQSN